MSTPQEQSYVWSRAQTQLEPGPRVPNSRASPKSKQLDVVQQRTKLNQSTICFLWGKYSNFSTHVYEKQNKTKETLKSSYQNRTTGWVSNQL